MSIKKLKLVDPTAPLRPEPPRPLGRYGLALWKAVHAEYGIEDAGGMEMLAQACGALDRAEACRALIDRDGEVIRTKTTGMKDHPALKHELANRSFVVRTLARLALDVEAIKPVGRPPMFA